MKLVQIQDILSTINGCTFASLDADYMTVAAVRKVTKNEQVILFTNKKSSGYENMVRRRLTEIGKDPDSFILSPLPWGDRIEGTPLIYHPGRDEYYLQTILLKPGETECYVGPRKVDCSSIKAFRRQPDYRFGFPEGKKVLVHTYKLASITEIRVQGEKIRSENDRKILGLKYKDGT